MKHCPFCHSPNLICGNLSAFEFAVRCKNCNANGPIVKYPNKTEDLKNLNEFTDTGNLDKDLTDLSIKLWNMRNG